MDDRDASDPATYWNFPVWNPKQPETNGCSNMAIEILYIANGCLGKHQFLSGCLGFQVGLQPHVERVVG